MSKLPFLLFLSSVSLSFGQTDLLSTDFQNGIPSNFSLVTNDSNIPASAVSEYTAAWIVVQDPENNTDSVAASTSYFEPVGSANRWLITPPLVLGSFGNHIEWQAKSQDASFPDDYLVLVSTTTNELASFTDTIGSVNEEFADWTYRTVNLSLKGYDSETIYVAFVNTTDNGFKLYLDDIRVWKEDPLSIEPIQSIDFRVFPNPSDGTLFVKSNSAIEKINVYQVNGQHIQEFSSDILDISHLPSGIYFVEVQTNKQIGRIKIIRK